MCVSVKWCVLVTTKAICDHLVLVPGQCGLAHFFIMPSAPTPPPFTLQVFFDLRAIFLDPVVIWSSSLRELMSDQVGYLPRKKERKKEDWEIEVEIAEQMGDVTVILPSFAVLEPIQIAQILAVPSHSDALGAPWILLPDLACTRIESARPQKKKFSRVRTCRRGSELHESVFYAKGCVHEPLLYYTTNRMNREHQIILEQEKSLLAFEYWFLKVDRKNPPPPGRFPIY